MSQLLQRNLKIELEFCEAEFAILKQILQYDIDDDIRGFREAPLKLLTKAFLGHFISEKGAPNHPGKGLDPPKSHQILAKKVAPNFPGKC